MFVDIPTFAKLRETEGEETAREFLGQCLALLEHVIQEYGGEKIRSVGGTLLCSFTDTQAALQASCAMLERVVAHNFGTKTPQTLRMGLHAGSVKLRGGSCTGEAVTTTSRMVTIAVPGQIVATEAILAEADAGMQARFEHLKDAERMEGRLKTVLYEVDWHGASSETPSTPGAIKMAQPSHQAPPASKEQGHEAGEEAEAEGEHPHTKDIGSKQTRHVLLRRVGQRKGKAKSSGATKMPTAASKAMADAAADSKSGSTGPVRFCAIWRENVLVVDDKSTVLRIGRNGDNEVVVTVDTASRYHARVEYRNGAIVLIDTSSNGTFVYNQTGDETYIQEGEVFLKGSGAICIGCQQDYPGAEPLLFWMA